jgi:hypothetical protein
MSVKSYVKKPIPVEAIQYLTDNIGEIIVFLEDFPHRILPSERMIIIHTLEGEHLVRHGDYVVKGPYGEYYPVKPTIFEETYVQTPTEVVNGQD